MSEEATKKDAAAVEEDTTAELYADTDGAAADAGGEAGGDDETKLDDADAEIEKMKAQVAAMEEEAKKIEQMQEQVQKQLKPATHSNGPDVDSRSVYVGNVDYSTTPTELNEFFSSCGAVARVTILCDKYTGHPKGFAYVEFKSADSIANALILNGTEFKGRALKITPKRTNVPGFGSRRRRRRRSYGYGGGGYGGGGYGGYRPRRRRRRSHSYHPY
eukprot:TRINITY_DN65950_c9_g4_i1.p1 TRINITY_DN65950_c9_g4~~TRINITY_DN65950_c9_g4_i1.p1  ORF type:complete len:217 (+),score=130.38 TRINITY_DN65950_c9_g4_i1:34-684(+)